MRSILIGVILCGCNLTAAAQSQDTLAEPQTQAKAYSNHASDALQNPAATTLASRDLKIIWVEAEQPSTAHVMLAPVRVRATLASAPNGTQDPRVCVMETGSRIRVRNKQGICSNLPGKAFTRKGTVNTGNSGVMGSLRTMDPAIN